MVAVMVVGLDISEVAKSVESSIAQKDSLLAAMLAFQWAVWLVEKLGI